MAYSTMTRTELEDLLRSWLRNLIPGADLSEGSDYDLTARAFAAVLHGTQAQGDFIVRQILPSTATGEWLVLHAAIRGIAKATAAGSSGRVLMTATTEPHNQAATSTLQHSDGTAYITDAAGPLAAPGWSGKTVGPGATMRRIPVLPDTSGMAAGDPVTIDGRTTAIKAVLTGVSSIDLYEDLGSAPVATTAITAAIGAVVDISAVDTGATTNKPVGDSLTLDSPVHADVAAAVVVLELAGGGDIETDTELRQRIRDFMSFRPASGNVAHYRSWARSTAGSRLADAFVYPGLRGFGTVSVLPFGITGARMTSTPVNNDIDAKLTSEVSFIDDHDVAQWTEHAPAVDVDLTVTAAPGYEPDWSGFETVAAAPVSTTVLVELTSTAPQIEVGDRVLVLCTVGSRQVLAESKVISNVTAGGTRVGVSPALPGVPVAGEPVYAGGPLAQLAFDGLEALFDDLGPGDTEATTGIATRHPSPAEAHPDQITIASLFAVAMGIEGVANVSVAAPAADVTPSVLARLALGKLTLRWA